MKNNIRKILTSLILAVFLSGAAFSLTACAARIKIPDEHYSEADVSLINPEADECAVELMSYLKSIYGKYVLSGQYINEYEDFEAAEFRADPDDPLSPATVFKANELQAAFEENTKCLGFCTWCREFVCVYLEGEDGEYRTYPEYGAMCNTAEELKAVYDDARVLTLSDLPRCDTELIQVIALFCKAW